MVITGAAPGRQSGQRGPHGGRQPLVSKRGAADCAPRRGLAHAADAFGHGRHVTQALPTLGPDGGVWQRLLETMQEPDADWIVRDSTIVRAHTQAVGS